jgi:hypothetical protein
MKILTDTREQLPYWKDKRITLIVGDYTTVKLKNKFHVERKSLQDLYGTLTSGNNRFKYELFRAAWHRIKIEVHVEGSREDFINKRFPKGNERKFTKDGLDRLVATFEKKYFLKFHWHKGREHAKKEVYKRLKVEETGGK